MPLRAPHNVSDEERRRVLQWCETVQGCSDVLCEAARGLADVPDEQQRAPAVDVRSSMMHAVQHFESYHGPSDSVFLAPSAQDELPWLQQGAAQLPLVAAAVAHARRTAPPHRQRSNITLKSSSVRTWSTCGCCTHAERPKTLPRRRQLALNLPRMRHAPRNTQRVADSPTSCQGMCTSCVRVPAACERAARRPAGP